MSITDEVFFIIYIVCTCGTGILILLTYFPLPKEVVNAFGITILVLFGIAVLSAIIQLFIDYPDIIRQGKSTLVYEKIIIPYTSML